MKAQFSECKKFRYRLTIENTAKKSGNSLCVIMQNPSIANTEIADKSVQFLERLVFEKQVELFKYVNTITIVNQFAYIQTKGFVGSTFKIGKENDNFIRQAIRDSEIVTIAWGKTNSYLKRQEDILRIVYSFEGKKILMTKKHPSRGTYQDFMLPFSN